jgi:hypothetical protein
VLNLLYLLLDLVNSDEKFLSSKPSCDLFPDLARGVLVGHQIIDARFHGGQQPSNNHGVVLVPLFNYLLRGSVAPYHW